MQRSAREEQNRRLRAINPEIPPDRVLGDVGFHSIDLDDIERDATAWSLGRLANITAGIFLIFAAVALLLILIANLVLAHDDGRYAGSPLKSWFDQLASGKGLCCSFVDGLAIEDVDWDTTGNGQRYRVRLDGKWIDVPDAAVVKEPNKFGRAVVWPFKDADGVTQIRCFLAGSLS